MLTCSSHPFSIDPSAGCAKIRGVARINDIDPAHSKHLYEAARPQGTGKRVLKHRVAGDDRLPVSRKNIRSDCLDGRQTIEIAVDLKDPGPVRRGSLVNSG